MAKSLENVTFIKSVTSLSLEYFEDCWNECVVEFVDQDGDAHQLSTGAYGSGEDYYAAFKHCSHDRKDNKRAIDAIREYLEIRDESFALAEDLEG